MNHPQLEAYVLGELPEAERVEVELYIASNAQAALEVERLQVVTAALKRLPEEEPPRRIAFVSDKVFEPKWYQRLWDSGPRLAFVSAALLAMAILAHGFITAPSKTVTTVVAGVSKEEVDAAVAQAVAQVRAESEARTQKLLTTALDQAEKKFELERAADRATVAANFEVWQKQMRRAMYIASSRPAGGDQ